MEAKIEDFADYAELSKALEPLGFVQTEIPGFFSHGIVRYNFDFTACSVHGAMKVFFDRAANIGYESCQERMREVMGL